MSVSGQADVREQGSEKGPRGRMRRLMLDTAVRLMQSGVMPSVSEVGEAAGVSRATAYRHFPSQAALIQAAVDDALGPILSYEPSSTDPRERVTGLIEFAFPRMESFEATHRAALLLALDQWLRRQAGTLGEEPRVVRGNRRGLLRAAVEPLKDVLGRAGTERVAQAMSLIFGIEAIIVLKDIWGLDAAEAQDVIVWTAQALIGVALRDAGAEGETAPAAKPRGVRKTGAATRPRVKGG
ncbi:TetR/AcrR family transcriptional regulator [Prosthecomicrobium pneumaticum]